MADALAAHPLVEAEARALLARAERVRPLALTETMVVAATFSVTAQAAIERHLAAGRHALRRRAHEFLAWLHTPAGAAASAEEQHRRLVFLRLEFNVVLTQFDLFSEVMTQRSEHETGVFLAGLDAVATDALAVPGLPGEPPPVVCYLQRGQGASIRRARTRLPGGGENPVAIIAVPRERMVGSGIASSLVHEVGHQGAALLGLVESVRAALQRRAAEPAREAAYAPPAAPGAVPPLEPWRVWDRWCSEMLADFWSVARVGVASTLGLMGVVALPRAFVFRRTLDEAHPVPWLRVLLSCAFGDVLYPHPQWARLARTWESFYPTAGLDAAQAAVLARLRATIPEVARLFAAHRAPALGGRTLAAALGDPARQPERLLAQYAAWERAPLTLRAAPPSLAFAALGQARADGRLTPEREGRLLAHLLTNWALRSVVDATEACAGVRRPAARTAVTAA